MVQQPLGMDSRPLGSSGSLGLRGISWRVSRWPLRRVPRWVSRWARTSVALAPLCWNQAALRSGFRLGPELTYWVNPRMACLAPQ